MTTLDDVADVETVDRPATKSPDTRAAVNYLIASGATAISIIETETGCSFRVGHKIDPRAVEICWLTAARAKPLVRLARKQAGRHPNVATASAALAQAAAALRATLTPHDVALSRGKRSRKARRLHRKPARPRRNAGIHKSISATTLGGGSAR
jgi:hypothetical protein